MGRRFTGTTSNAIVPVSGISSLPMTIACWHYSFASSTSAILASANTNSTTTHYNSMDSASLKPSAAARVATQGIASASCTFKIKTWNHTAGVYYSSTLRKCFLNGGYVGQNTNNLTPNAPTQLQVGRRATAASDNQIIAEVGFWKIALRDADILALAQGVKPCYIHPEHLIGYWPLTGKYNLIEPDANPIYPGRYNLTITDAPVANHPAFMRAPQHIYYKVARIWAPNVTATPTLTAGVGSFSESGQTVGLNKSLIMSCSTGSYSLTGIDATLGRRYNLSCSVGNFSESGQTALFTKQLRCSESVGVFTLSGQSAGLNRSVPITGGTGTYILSGQAATLTKQWRITASTGAYTLSGQAATFTKQLSLTSTTGTYILSGQIALLTKQLHCSESVGTFTLSGQSAGISRNVPITTNTGTYALGGQIALLTKQLQMTSSVGSYALSGQPAGLTKQFLLVSSVGSFVESGQVALLTKHLNLGFGVGSFTVSGQNAGLSRQVPMSASTGTYVLSGQTVTLTKQLNVGLDTGTFTLSGQNTELSRQIPITATTGSYILNGQNATLTAASGATIYTLTAATGGIIFSGLPVTSSLLQKISYSLSTVSESESISASEAASGDVSGYYCVRFMYNGREHQIVGGMSIPRVGTYDLPSPFVVVSATDGGPPEYVPTTFGNTHIWNKVTV